MTEGFSIVKREHDTDTAYKAVEFIETYTGRAFWPLAPRVQDVSIIDIAHHLSNQTRYSGAPEFFYPTAQHCCLLTDFVIARGGTPLDGLQILMHDAPEAYLIDVVRPVKQHMPEFRKWDKGINNTIREWLDIANIPIPDWQDELDSRIIVDERAQIMSDSGLDWGHDLVPLGIQIDPWTNVVAEQQFLFRYAALSQEIYGKPQYLRAAWGTPTGEPFIDARFRAKGGDRNPVGDPEPVVVTDLIEVDIRGGVGRVVMRSPNGMMIRDTRAGKFPRAAWKWMHGKFDLIESPAKEKVTA